jgi:hypothetical protein
VHTAVQLARVIDAFPRRAASLLLVLALGACGGPRQEQLAGGIDLLAGDAIELPSREPLGGGDPRGQLCLTPRAPFRINADSIAFRTPYARFARPVALAVRADGGVDSLTEASVRANEDLCLTTRAATARPPWRAVRLVSAVDLSLDRVAWHDR